MTEFGLVLVLVTLVTAVFLGVSTHLGQSQPAPVTTTITTPTTPTLRNCFVAGC
jgi:hypothetical protein